MERKIYSLNLASYLVLNGFKDYTVHRDEKGLCYVEFDGFVDDLIQRYKQDKQLHSYLQCFREIKRDVNNVKFNKGQDSDKGRIPFSLVTMGDTTKEFLVVDKSLKDLIKQNIKTQSLKSNEIIINWGNQDE